MTGYSKDDQLNSGRVQCPCGCGVVGGIRKKSSHVRGCKCRPCIGSRNRTSGLKKQRTARRELGIPKARYHGQHGNEEQWNGPFRVEVKSGLQTKALASRFLSAEDQSDSKKAVGDARLFCFVAMPPQMGSEGLVVVRLSAWREHIAPRFEEAS